LAWFLSLRLSNCLNTFYASIDFLIDFVGERKRHECVTMWASRYFIDQRETDKSMASGQNGWIEV
jgi:hypothetical protein